MSNGKRISALCIGALLLLLLQGCIKDDFSKCKLQMRLYVVVTGSGGGRGVVPDGAIMYLFDKNRRYIRCQEVSEEAIVEKIPMELSYKKDDPPWVVVWGNMGGCGDIPNLIPGTPMEELLVTLREGENGFHLAPSMLYHGMKQLAGMSLEEVPISQKIGRIALTTRGLPTSRAAHDYYYTVKTGYARYDFSGAPLTSEATFRLPGAFRGDDFIIPLPHNMIHHPSDCHPDDAVVVSLYDATRSEADPVISANRDSQGRPIIIEPGKTTNVLLDLSGEAELNVSVVVTDWSEIFQWNEW